MIYQPAAAERPDRYKITVDQYTAYNTDGFLVVPDLVPLDDVERVKSHAMDILYGRAQIPGVESPSDHATTEELIHRFSRVHMLHRVDAVSEQCMLNPRILDVLEALAGPDVLALQTMLFYNAPGMGGQGWHQDSFYITTYPDTLIGAWLALERADEENGCMWLTPGSHRGPIYPDRDRGSLIHTGGAFQDLPFVEGISSLDDSANSLAHIASQWPDPAPAVAEAGAVVFFHGHILHRSYPNRSKERWRRAFVSHYCNARSWVPWGHGGSSDDEAANYQHILARGRTHLPFALPTFGTPCAALDLKAEAGLGQELADTPGASAWLPAF